MKAESEGRRHPPAKRWAGNEECRSGEKLGSGIRAQPLGCKGLRQLWRHRARRQIVESEVTVRREPRRTGFVFRRPRQTVYGGWLGNLVEREGVIKSLTVRNLMSPGAESLFGNYEGCCGEVEASPQRAVATEPTPATDKRPAARRVFAEKAVWLRLARECLRSCSVVAARSASFVAPRHPAFSPKTAPLVVTKQALRDAAPLGLAKSRFASATAVAQIPFLVSWVFNSAFRCRSRPNKSKFSPREI